jgi:hypothetical protein
VETVTAPTIRSMTRPELISRKAELERILEVLSAHTIDSVCTELGEISYLLDDRTLPRDTKVPWIIPIIL